MEIERKFLLERFNGMAYERQELEQAYISTDPVIRVRRAGDEYWLTVKGGGTLMRAEFELPITEAQYARLMAKAETGAVHKTRCRVPLAGGLVAEADVYHGALAPLMTVEVEFPDEGAAKAFAPPAWFGREVTEDGRYANSALARFGLPERVSNFDNA